SHGLSDILRSRRGTFSSVRSGIDYEVWNPGKDPYLAANYSLADMSGKNACKQALLRECGLRLSEKAPVIAFVSHLSRHKGTDILIEALDGIGAMEAGLVVCGEGEEKFELALAAAARRHRGKMAVWLEMRPSLVHKVVAGADILLIPSLHEPCGLNQFYGFRYGAVPVVRATGGLKETVRPYVPATGEGNGFVFREYSAAALLDAVRKAVDCYRNAPGDWRKIREAGLRHNFSLEVTARGYLRLYEKALHLKRRG
ncbi:MAG: glycogen synthase, partial [Candidatus Aminicenantes bacterium]|nr:glycogen synthase [Candidatus Aminicenantes bacterium]